LRTGLRIRAKRIMKAIVTKLLFGPLASAV
jgi:hypothetical protein